ncbi:hypothetical protein BGZ61DRAFT_526604 [Ilyonectria robusta]|uniref:uncharacterized protein n=1 Tax=Ilyonectria robusta TaxID=1079257 RepID=UPI001E8DC48D|nr:uncharacterized protein BGZ61DRAFT_526604 [Ilyonectria robusta]KAH8735534.1 hypothetical protein BGZ61DRAFT_526604 [Ilyonectria robusta]
MAELPCESTPPSIAHARNAIIMELTTTRLTDALDAETPLNASELNVLRSQYEREGDMVGVQTKFNYAWVNPPPSPSPSSPTNVPDVIASSSSNRGLVKSNQRQDQQLGVRLLSEIFRLSPERRRECLYYLALGNYKLGNYGEARRYNDLLLDKEPANLQASNLRQLIDDKVAKEGLMGVAILSGVGLAAGVVGAFILRNSRRR